MLANCGDAHRLSSRYLPSLTSAARALIVCFFARRQYAAPELRVRAFLADTFAPSEEPTNWVTRIVAASTCALGEVPVKYSQ